MSVTKHATTDELRESAYGKFRSDFLEASLGSLCNDLNGIQTGPFGSQLHQRDYVSSGTPIITVEHLGENRIIHQDMPYVSDDDRDRLSKYTLREGDIVFSRVGSVDRRALVREIEDGWLFSGRCLRVRPDVTKVIPAYLSYFFGLPAFQEYIRSIAVGATMPSLNTGILCAVSILVPPLAEQRAIAHVLGKLDDKIELNRRMNETLEAMARALFKSWFVDFKPVRAKMEGRWRPGEPLLGLPADLYDLFPEQLVPSELGEIPEGWEVKSLGEVASVSSGKRPGHRQSVADDKVHTPLWGGNGPMGFVDSPLIDSPILLTGRVGTLGSVFRINSPCWPSDNTLVVTPDSSELFESLFFQMERFDFDSLNRGSTQPLLTQADLKAQLVISPANELIGRFHAFTKALFQGIDARNHESRALAAQRDIVLPRLVSGQLKLESV